MKVITKCRKTFFCEPIVLQLSNCLSIETSPTRAWMGTKGEKELTPSDVQPEPPHADNGHAT